MVYKNLPKTFVRYLYKYNHGVAYNKSSAWTSYWNNIDISISLDISRLSIY